MILRTTKFFGFCYADELIESEFFAKNFRVSKEHGLIIFSFDWMKGLDLKKIKLQLKGYRFFEIEDAYLRDKLVEFIKENNNTKKMKLEVDGFSIFIKHLKFTHKGFVIQLV